MGGRASLADEESRSHHQVPDDQTSRVVQSVIESARTGGHDNGVMFVTTVVQTFNIATLYKDEKVVI